MKIDWLRIPKNHYEKCLDKGISQSTTYIYIYLKKSDAIIRVRKENRSEYSKQEIKQLITKSRNIEIVAKQISDQSIITTWKKEG